MSSIVSETHQCESWPCPCGVDLGQDLWRNEAEALKQQLAAVTAQLAEAKAAPPGAWVSQENHQRALEAVTAERDNAKHEWQEWQNQAVYNGRERNAALAREAALREVMSRIADDRLTFGGKLAARWAQSALANPSPAAELRTDSDRAAAAVCQALVDWNVADYENLDGETYDALMAWRKAGQS